jgi:hypothetical protein
MQAGIFWVQHTHTYIQKYLHTYVHACIQTTSKCANSSSSSHVINFGLKLKRRYSIVTRMDHVTQAFPCKRARDLNPYLSLRTAMVTSCYIPECNKPWLVA